MPTKIKEERKREDQVTGSRLGDWMNKKGRSTEKEGEGIRNLKEKLGIGGVEDDKMVVCKNDEAANRMKKFNQTLALFETNTKGSPIAMRKRKSEVLLSKPRKPPLNRVPGLVPQINPNTTKKQRKLRNDREWIGLETWLGCDNLKESEGDKTRPDIPSS